MLTLNKKYFILTKRILSVLLASQMLVGPMGIAPLASAAGLPQKDSFVKSNHPNNFKNSSTQLKLNQNYGQLPLAFEPNQGQEDPQVKFLSHGGGYSLFLTGTEAVLLLKKHVDEYPLHPNSHFSRPKRQPPPDILRLQLKGVNTRARFEGLEALPGITNYFIGSDPAKWVTKIPQFGRVTMHEAYPGVDMTYYGNQRRLEYDFEVKPGGDPGVIRINYVGADSARVDGDGNLRLAIKGRDVVFQAPVVYQDDKGIRTPLKGRYIPTGDRELGFEVENYDKTRKLIIDPVLSYGTYLGGSGADGANAIAVDSAGNAYLTGASSGNFPTTPGAYQTTFGAKVYTGLSDVFVSKLDPTGSTLIYSTYIGGTDTDYGQGIAVDGSGDAYVTGQAGTAFPTTPGAYQTAFGGAGGDYYFGDAFLAKMNPAGTSLLYSTYLGSTGWEVGSGIDLGAGGVACITGWTNSAVFPTTTGAFRTISNGSSNDDVFIAKINPASGGASDLLYSTLLGVIGSGNIPDDNYAIKVDGNGNTYVVGGTKAGPFMTTAGSYQPGFVGNYDIFVVKLNPAGLGAADLVFSTYLGNGTGYGYAITLDASRNVYITGSNAGGVYPTTPGAYSPTYVAGLNAIVAELSANGSSLLYSTYLEQAGSSSMSWAAYGRGIALDNCGDIYVVGGTSYSAFPMTAGAFETGYSSSGFAGFMTVLNPSLSGAAQLVFSTFLGSTTNTFCYGLAQDPAGNLYTAGYTLGGMLTTGGSYQTTYAGGTGYGGDAFALKIDVSSICAQTVTPTNTATPTPTNSPTNTPTNTGTLPPTNTATNTPTQTPTNTASNSPTPTPTRTPPSTATNSPTQTNTSSATNSPTITPTRTLTNSPTLTPTSTLTSTITNTPQITFTPTITPTFPTDCDTFYVSKNLFNPGQESVSIYVVYCSDIGGDFALNVYNTAGEHIRTLDERRLTGSFSSSYLWDGINKHGDSCASGGYVIQMVNPFKVKNKRVLLVR